MYLFKLADRIASGLRQFDRDRLEVHRSFIRSRQLAGGGFGGREDEPDLYYTGFAIRGLAVSGGLEESIRDRVTEYLGGIDPLTLNVVDLLSWLYGALVIQASGGADLLEHAPEDFVIRVGDRVEAMRVADGGYSKSTDGALGSTYQTFLSSLVYELIGQDQPLPNRLIQFLYDRQREDGGFVEIAPMKRSGTNPTAAAIALLTKFEMVDEDLRHDVIAFLTEVRSPEGGFQANTRIPFADGLSTFTGLLTALELNAGHVLPPPQVERWLANDIEIPTGGFRGASWDKETDVEYTFYGLGIRGLLGSIRNP